LRTSPAVIYGLALPFFCDKKYKKMPIERLMFKAS